MQQGVEIRALQRTPHIILLNPSAFGIHDTKFSLRPGVSLLRRQFKPHAGFLVILRDAEAIEIKNSEGVLCVGIAFYCPWS